MALRAGRLAVHWQQLAQDETRQNPAQIVTSSSQQRPVPQTFVWPSWLLRLALRLHRSQTTYWGCYKNSQPHIRRAPRRSARPAALPARSAPKTSACRASHSSVATSSSTCLAEPPPTRDRTRKEIVYRIGARARADRGVARGIVDRRPRVAADRRRRAAAAAPNRHAGARIVAPTTSERASAPPPATTEPNRDRIDRHTSPPRAGRPPAHATPCVNTTTIDCFRSICLRHVALCGIYCVFDQYIGREHNIFRTMRRGANRFVTIFCWRGNTIVSEHT